MTKKFRVCAIVAVVLVAMTSLVFLAIQQWRNPDGERQFEIAFGIAPPPGVTAVVAHRRYVGGPGDIVVLLRFRADRTAISEIVSARGLDRDSDFEAFVLSPNENTPAPAD